MRLLNWSGSRHWDYDAAKPCRYCGRDTRLRDGKGSSAHKVCAEDAIAQQAAERAEDRAAGLI
jgi:hypothetical protein